jgi:hypothetical protein
VPSDHLATREGTTALETRESEAAVLSRIAAELLTGRAPTDIHRIIGGPVHQLSGSIATLVTALNPEKNTVRFAHAEGIGQMLAFIRRLGLGHLMETEVPLSAMTKEEIRLFTSGKLYPLEGGLHVLSGRMLPTWLCSLLETTFHIRAFSSMGFSWKGNLYGGITLFQREKGPVPETPLIEAIVNLGAVALHGAYADEERARLREQLLQSQKMEAVGRLAAGIAHDFNNLLTVITGSSEMIADMPAAEPVAAEVSQIREAAQRAAELTRQLLSFSRREMEQPVVIPAGKAVGGMSTMIRRMIGEEIHLDLALPGADDCVRIDPSQLTQVMLNLADRKSVV